MSKNILADADFEAVTEVAHGRQIIKIAMVSHQVPIVAATYTAQGSRLCHENLANLPELTLRGLLQTLDARAALATAPKCW